MTMNRIFNNRYLITGSILLLFNLTLSGCYSLKETAIEDDQSIKIYKLESFTGDTVDFNKSESGYATLIDDNVVSTNSDGEKELYPKSNVKKYYTEKFDAHKTIWLVIGCSAVFYIVLLGLFGLSMDDGGFGG